MNKELFDSMQKQMTPSPEVRAALSEKLAQPVKKRPAPWMKYGALAACAALVIGGFSVYSLRQNPQAWMLIIRNFHHNVEVQHLHSYVTVEGLTGGVQENTSTTETGGGDAGQEILPAPNTGDLPSRDSVPSGALPGGAYIGDAPVQAGAEDYEKLMDHFNGTLPDWYGGAYLNESGWLVVQLVEDKDPADKSLELQVLDWTGSDNVMFSSCKYSLNQLKELMDRLNALPDEDMKFRDVMAGWGIDEEANRIELTLTQIYEPLLSVLAELDPDDDAIYVQVGQRASHDLGEDVRTDSAKTEDPAVHHAVPGGVTVPDYDDLIADEPYYEGVRDGAHYDVEDLPQQKLPAFGVDSVPEEDTSAFTPAYDPDVGFIYPKE